MPTDAPAMSIEKRHAQPETMGQRVVRLMPRLQRAAYSLGNTTSRTVDAGDLAQAMAVTLLEHDYLNVDGYCVRFAKHRAVDRLRADATYRRYVDVMPALLGEDDEVLDFDEFLPAPGQDPEDALIDKQERAEILERLNATQRRVLTLLANGYSKAEIAEKLGVSRPRISQHLEAIRTIHAAVNDHA